jgi:hypothetical protein
MAGSITVSSITLDSDNNFSIKSNTGATLFSANGSGIISGVQNTAISGVITAGQLATSLNLATNNVQVASIQSATGTPGITFAANGQVTLANTPLQLTGGQLQFPATQIPSGDANTLDDYEEGTWTPTLVFSGGAGTLSYATRTGYYTKIGRVVYISMNLIFSKGTASGTMDNISGLPFSSGEAFGSGALIDNMSGLVGAPVWITQGSLVYIYMTNTGALQAVNATNMGASSNVFRFAGYYNI